MRIASEPKFESGADVIARIVLKNTNRVFLYPGGTVAPILNSLLENDIKLYTARSEQGAGFAAIGAARVSNRTEVVLVSSGPGVTNLVTSIADAFCDSNPLVAICGQVGQLDSRKNLPIRQLGFQEVDNHTLFQSVSKKVFSPQSLDELYEQMQEAFVLASHGRPGPIVVNVHMNLQREEFTKTKIESKETQVAHKKATDSTQKLKSVIERMSSAKRPMFILGQGALGLSVAKSIREFVDSKGVPVSHSLHALGILNSSHELNLGFHGHTGERIAGKAIQEADFILILGSRLDIRQTGTEFKEFGRSSYKVRVDIDPNELEHSRVECDLSFNADVGIWFSEFVRNFPAKLNWTDSSWTLDIKRRIIKSQEEKLIRRTEPEINRINPYLVISYVNRVFRDMRLNIVTGVGSHQQWVAREFEFDYPKSRWLTSGGLGTMGFDVPVSIGAAIARPDSETICMVGDGSLQMNLQELAFLEENNLPVKIIVFDNNRLGIVSQFQKMNWSSDPTCGNKRNPSFTAIGSAFGIPSDEVAKVEDLEQKLIWLRDLKGPGLLTVKTNTSIDVSPMLLPKDPLDKMWPYESVIQ